MSRSLPSIQFLNSNISADLTSILKAKQPKSELLLILSRNQSNFSMKMPKENNFKFGKDKSKIPTKGMCNQKKFACFVIEVLLSFIIFCHHKKLLTFRVSTCQVCKIRLFIFCSMPFHSRKPKKNKWREEKEKSHLASTHTIG